MTRRPTPRPTERTAVELTSKGQLVIPKRIRDAVLAKTGTQFSVRVEGRCIVLEIPRH